MNRSGSTHSTGRPASPPLPGSSSSDAPSPDTGGDTRSSVTRTGSTVASHGEGKAPSVRRQDSQVSGGTGYQTQTSQGSRSLTQRSVSREESEGYVTADDADSASSVARPDYDPSCTILSEEGLDEKQIEYGDSTISAKQYRDMVLDSRKQVMGQQCDLLARKWMSEQSPALIRGMSDPEYAQRAGIKIVLEVSGRPCQIIPYDANSGLDEQTRNLYLSYVQSSVVDMVNKLPPKKELDEAIDKNKKFFKHAKKTLNKLGVKIDSGIEQDMMKNTRIVLELKNGSGSVWGEHQSDYYVPDSALKRLPESWIRPNNVVVRSDSDSMLNSGLFDSNPLPRRGRQPLPTNNDEDEWEDDGDSGHSTAYPPSTVSSRGAPSNNGSDPALSPTEVPPPPPPPPIPGAPPPSQTEPD